MPRNHDVNFKY